MDISKTARGHDMSVGERGDPPSESECEWRTTVKPEVDVDTLQFGPTPVMTPSQAQKHRVVWVCAMLQRMQQEPCSRRIDDMSRTRTMHEVREGRERGEDTERQESSC